MLILGGTLNWNYFNRSLAGLNSTINLFGKALTNELSRKIIT